MGPSDITLDMDIKVGEHRMDLRGQVWQITRLENRCAYVRTPDLILDDHREERAFTQHQVRQWPVVQIQPVPEVPADPPLLPCPFCGAQPRLFNCGGRASIGCTCGVGISAVRDRNLAVTKWNARTEPKSDGLQWEFDQETLQLSVLIPAAPKPIRVPFGRLDIQMLGTFRKDYLRLFVRSLNHGLSKLDKAPRPKAQRDVRWTYNRNTQILIGEIEDDESIESFRCFLRLAAADDRSTKAIDLVLHQLQARVEP